MSSAEPLEPRQGPENPPGEPPELISRRTLLNRIIVGLGAAAGAVVSVPIVAYLLSPLINPAPQVWRDLGSVDKYQIGTTVQASIQEPSPLPWAGQTALTAVWVRRDAADKFTVFAVGCTHLGCPVRWMPDANLFLCPCHGVVYYSDGRVAAGPPPKPLPQYETRVQGGQVQILTRPLPLTS
jgi:quinol---cytochrome c reductase iron-sulfur subunit, bacillus type